MFASGVIYAFYLIGAGEIVGEIGAMRFTAYAMLVATIFFGYWFLSEPVTVIQITGAELVLAGVALVSARRT